MQSRYSELLPREIQAWFCLLCQSESLLKRWRMLLKVRVCLYRTLRV